MKSSFQFTNPVLKNLTFNLNDNFNNQENKKVQLGIKLSTQITKTPGFDEAVVELNIEIGERKANCPFFVNATEQANFRWPENMEESVINKLLEQNAPSLLLSYLRPIIVQVTAASPYGAYNIPFMNFTKEN